MWQRQRRSLQMPSKASSAAARGASNVVAYVLGQQAHVRGGREASAPTLVRALDALCGHVTPLCACYQDAWRTGNSADVAPWLALLEIVGCAGDASVAAQVQRALLCGSSGGEAGRDGEEGYLAALFALMRSFQNAHGDRAYKCVR